MTLTHALDVPGPYNQAGENIQRAQLHRFDERDELFQHTCTKPARTIRV